MKHLLISAMIALLAMPTLVAAQQDAAAERTIRQMMERRDRQIKALVGPEGTRHTEAQRDQMKDIINGIIDYSAMGRIALQGHYDTITEAQRTEFNQLFATVIRDQSLNKLDIYRARVIYDKITTDGRTATVETTAILDNVRTPVSYQMAKRGNDWVITDMAIDNVSTAQSYQRSFQNVIRRRGFDALLQSLRRRAAN